MSERQVKRERAAGRGRFVGYMIWDEVANVDWPMELSRLEAMYGPQLQHLPRRAIIRSAADLWCSRCGPAHNPCWCIPEAADG